MSHVIKTTVYEFDELGGKAKERAREWWREGALDHEWWAPTYEDAKAVLARAGFTIKDIFFSGFSSQGDGACFNGTWYAEDVKPTEEMKEYAPKDEELHRLAREAEEIKAKYPEASTSIKHHGFYYHRFCTEIEVDAGVGLEDAGKIRELARDAMLWIYQRLEAEYDYQMSEESCDESIRANEYTFTTEGKRFG